MQSYEVNDIVKHSPTMHGMELQGSAGYWQLSPAEPETHDKNLTCITMSYVRDSYRDIDSYVTILPSLPT